ncbi:hypothetical protein Tco_1257742, partial [Tanacetum coccineum]
TETPESPLTVAPPTSLPESTSPTLVAILYMIARMAVRVPPAMSSYESSPSSSSPDLPSRKCYRGTAELVEDDKEEDEEIEESLDSDRDESLAAGDEGPGIGVESHSLDDESRGLDDEGHSARELALEEDHVYSTFEPILTTWTNPEDGMVFIDVPAYPPPAPPVQISPSPEWSSGLLPISPSPSIVTSPISSPMIPLTVSSPVATLVTAETKGFFTKLGAQVEMQGGLIRDHVVRLEEL